MHRRDFHRHLVAAALGCGTLGRCATGAHPHADSHAEENMLPIIDTHQHLWDLQQQEVPWLTGASDLLRRSYVTSDYLAATKGLNVVKTVYMEIDVAPAHHVAEVELVTQLCKSPEHPTVAAVIGGRPASEAFADYAKTMAKNPYVKGVRQVLHGSTPPGYCLSEPFVRSMRLLGELGLSFDLCLRPAELGDAVKLVAQCRDTQFIVDHCGNADVKAFLAAPRRGDAAPSHDPAAWRQAMSQLGQQEHVACKISGIVASVPHSGWGPEDLAPIINHCLDAFGPDRVVFGGDWPVCRVGAELAQWINALKQVVQDRPLSQQQKLLNDNAQRVYRLEA